MIEGMTRPRPPYLLRERDRRTGATIWYVRKGDGQRTRIRGVYMSDAFMAAYHAAIAGEMPEAKPKAGTGSLAWLIARYMETSHWSRLSRATRRQRQNIFERIIAKAGAADFADIDRKSIVATMEAKKETPFAARNFLETMRGLFRWAHEAEIVPADPTEGVKAHRPPTEGFKPWTQEQIAQFEKRWPLGTRERLALDILQYTGLRRGDVARLGRQHIRDGVITLTTEKGGEVVTIPILPPLAASIAACPSNGLALIATQAGTPMVKESFGTWFAVAVKAAGLSGISAHGLRKSAATEAANNSATVAEMESIFGWRGGNMASLYTRKADRVRLAKGAIHKLEKKQS